MVEDSLDVLYNTPIEEYCANDMGYMQMLRYMNLNLEQLDVLALSFGTSVLAGENKVSDDIMFYDYRYANNINYLRRYQRRDADGVTNSIEQTSNSYGNYTGNNSLYSRRTNLYYDDNDTGENNFTNTQKTDRYIENQNPNSILSKTKQLFKDRKIRTIISRFRTDNEDDLANSFTESARSQFGLSHGRNLLTKDAESRNTPYHWNGYEDPYCRVWTHHHQYSDVRARLIRPFSIETEDGQTSTATSAMVNSWQNFEDVVDVYDNFDGQYFNEPWFKEIGYKVGANIDWGDGGDTQKAYQKKLKETEKEKWGWRKKGAEGYKYSVLNNGVLNITPKYIKGAETNVHTKDCMFSIENLAWQGYDPYSFEKALSWEQRGPFGGRIMWFPPYGLAFNEETSANWNEQTFIGRGESVYTYANTNRTGTLRFTLVVDHPSIVDYATWDARNTEGTTANASEVAGTNDKILKDTDILRFFAGCDNPDGGAGSGGSGDENRMLGDGNNGMPPSSDGSSPSSGKPNGGGVLQSFAKPTPLTDEYMRKDTTPHKPIKENPKPEPKKEETPPPTPDEEIQITFYVFYPNNYSGAFDRDGGVVDPIAYLLAGKGAQWRCNDKDVMQSESLPIKFDDLDPNDNKNLGNGYEMKVGGLFYDAQEDEKNYILGTKAYGKKRRYTPDQNKKWFYRIDGEYKNGIERGEEENCFGQKLITKGNNKDTKSFGLNRSTSKVKEAFPDEENNENLYSLVQIAYALETVKSGSETPGTKIQQLLKKQSENSFSPEDESMKRLVELLRADDSSVYKLTSIETIGYSNSHGSNASNRVNKDRNNFLAKQRGLTVFEWFKAHYKESSGISHENKTEGITEKNKSTGSKQVDKQDLKNVNGFSAKKWRSTKVTLKFTKSKTMKPEDLQPEPPKEEENVWTRFDGFVDTGKTRNVNGKEVQLFTNTNDDLDPTKRGRIWYYDEDSKEMILLEKSYATKPRYKEGDTASHSFNHIRYDQEYYFFKQLKENDPMVFKALTKKLQYFDPAFHSMTPEGFNARLTFLQQCMRQGDTTSASDKNGQTANNLAFGKQPVCILRLGDFFYTKIIIRNINFDYEPLVLDLNQEGAGVQPMLCNVSMSFNIIGGADITGPVRRLQNALSFNYYANSRLYDNRADRIERQRTNWETMGAMGNDKIDFEESKFNSVTKAKL